MNEHDSERIAGLLQADGLVETGERRRRRRRGAQHLLHPRERRQQALRHPRPPQVGEGPHAGHADRGRRVPGPEGPRRRHRSGPLRRRGARHPQRAPRRRPAPRGRDAGHSIVEILEETVAEDHDAFPSALPVRREVPWAGWVTIQIGCDNSCAFCIVPAVRGKEISRPFDDIVEEVRRAADDGVTEVTLLGQNVNSYGRDLTLAARQAGGGERVRPLFDRLLRAVGAVEGIHRVRYTSPHPKDLRPETIAAMAETPAVCEHLHLPLQSGSDRVLAAMHRGYTAERYLERLAGGPRRHRRPRRHHRHHRGLPRRDRRRLRAHPRGGRRGRLRQRLHVHLQPPARHRGRRDGRRARAARGGGRALRAAADRGRAVGPGRATRPASDGSRRCSWRARPARTRRS